MSGREKNHNAATGDAIATTAPPVSHAGTAVAKRSRSVALSVDRVRVVCKKLERGASLSAACRAARVSRRTFLRAVSRDADVRDRFTAALTVRAHDLATELVSIADGTDRESQRWTAELVAAVERVDPGRAEGVAKALLGARVQRDRLRFDARRWLSSRWLPATYGASTHTNNEHNVTVRVSFDTLSAHDEPTSSAGDAAEYEIIE